MATVERSAVVRATGATGAGRGSGSLAACLAAAWSLGYGALGVWWARGGAGFPFGEGDAGGADLSLLAGLRAETGAPVIAGLGGVGAVVGLALAGGWGGRFGRRAGLVSAWGMAAVLLLVAVDVRLLAVLGYLPAIVVGVVGVDGLGWPILNQFVCLAGGFAWGMAALSERRRGSNAAGGGGRAGGGVGAATTARWERWERWGRWAAYAAVVLPLPYAATRLAWALRIPLGVSGAEAGFMTGGGAVVPGFALGGMALGGALLTLGLVHGWEEVFPRWVPVLGGRRVPPALAVVPAAVVSVALTVGGLAIVRLQAGGAFAGTGWVGAVPGLAFLPWGVALGLATLAYQRRRAAATPAGPG